MDGNGNSLLSTFFDDTWDEKRVKEEIAYAAAIGNKSPSRDPLIKKAETSTPGVFMRLVYDDKGKLITAYIE